MTNKEDLKERKLKRIAYLLAKENLEKKIAKEQKLYERQREKLFNTPRKGSGWQMSQRYANAENTVDATFKALEQYKDALKYVISQIERYK